MAFELIKVSELPELTTPSDPNVIPIQDGDYLKRISFENLKEAVTDDVADDLAAEVTARESAVSGEATARGNADTAILADLASAYSASATYAVGDYCTKDGQLYRCTTAISTAEAWTSGHWSAVALGDDTSDLRSALTQYNLLSSSEVAQLKNIGIYSTQSGLNVAVSNGSQCVVNKYRTKINVPSLVKVECADGYRYFIFFNKSYGNGTIENASYGIFNTAGRFDAMPDQIVTVPNGTEAIFVAIGKVDGTDVTLADYDKVTFTLMYQSVYGMVDNGENIIDLNAISSGTSNGVTFTPLRDSCIVSGTSTAIAYKTINNPNGAWPSGIKKGSMVSVIYSSENVALHVIQYDKNYNVIASEMFYSNSFLSIRKETSKIEIRLRVASGVTIDETVCPVLMTHLTDEDIAKLTYLEQVDDTNNPVYQCAKSYYIMTRINGYTYGERSALYYGDGGDINQVHCGGIASIIVSGCSFYNSRYIDANIANKSFTAGYGFDFEAYSLKLAKAGNAAEIEYIGSENVNKTVEELKELMLFKTTYGLSTSCYRWNMIKYVMSNGTVDTSMLRIGDMVFYGKPNDGSPQMIDGKLITPQLIEGNLLTHCDLVIGYENDVPIVIDAGEAPISIHEVRQPSTAFPYVCVGRVPLFERYT